MRTLFKGSGLISFISRATALLGVVFVSIQCSNEPDTPFARYSFRALATPDDGSIWLAAQNGFWARSTDGGMNWDTGHVPGFDGAFRDVHAWNENEAILMGIESPGVIYKTSNGGKRWTLVHELNHPQTFFDQMEFNAAGNGIVLGDPIDGYWTILGTNNHGEDWIHWSEERSWPASNGEVSFAASGSALITDEESFTFFSGGYGIRFYQSGMTRPLKIASDTSSTFGAYSCARIDGNTFLIVGGDYRFQESVNRTAAIITKGTPDSAFVQWATTPPNGYRSCVKKVNDSLWVCTGPTGTDYSADGLVWKALTQEGYHTLSVDSSGKIWAAGGEGLIVELSSLIQTGIEPS